MGTARTSNLVLNVNDDDDDDAENAIKILFVHSSNSLLGNCSVRWKVQMAPGSF